ncbi:MAG TPA: Uma2 family endonuclease [Pyrinomonadaceae bacterium]|nr:Uma2 family endonuclease [Pyrinomonadaceae bacterium]
MRKRGTVSTAHKFTSADLLAMPDNGNRYELIEGELYVSKQPGFEHQYACGQLTRFINEWDERHGARGVAVGAPGVIFSDDDNVAPDVVWISRERLAATADEAGHLHAAPELVVEVLSPGEANETRDRQAKLKLYSRRGVREYWVVNWMQRLVEVHRREEGELKLAATLYAEDRLESPLLPGFTCEVAKLFFKPPEPQG